jgi:hypothetical protein
MIKESEMIHRLMIAFLILTFASISVMAQPGAIGVFADGGATSVDINDTAPGLLLVYIVHVNTPGATACQFSLPHPWCFGATYLAESVTPPNMGIGNSQTGIAIAYGGCVTSPNMVLTLQYFGQGTTPECCCLYVEADPTASPPGIYVTDCSEPPLLLQAYGGIAAVNANGGCIDWHLPAGCINDPTPVEQTTWGAIKAIYSK